MSISYKRYIYIIYNIKIYNVFALLGKVLIKIFSKPTTFVFDYKTP